MNEGKISTRQAISICTMYFIGSNLVLGIGAEAKRDVWIAAMITFLCAVPLMLLYGRLMQVYPGKNLYDLQLDLFGAVFGRVTTLLYTWYALHLGAMVIRNFTEFIQIVSLFYQPQFTIGVTLGLLAIWCVRTGRVNLGRWAAFVFPIYISIIAILTLLTTPVWHFTNLLPTLKDGFSPIFKGVFNMAAFPFAEAILLPLILQPLRKNSQAQWVFIIALAISAFTLTLVSVRNIMVLGIEFIQRIYYPSYATVTLINVGNFLDRIEVAVSLNFLAGGFVKIVVCLYAASLGLSKLLGFGDSKSFAVPVGVLMIVLSQFVFSSIMDTKEFAGKYYKYYIIPTSVILPILIWVFAEIKRKRDKKMGIEAQAPDETCGQQDGKTNQKTNAASQTGN